IHRLGYGAMQLTGPGVWGEPADRAQAIGVLRRAIELGINLIDTADSYGPYVSEDLIREALHPYPRGLVIATKAGLTRPGPGKWVPLGRPDYLRQECEMSLRRLGVERIDLFQLHRIDPKVPADDQFGVLRDLQKEGKIRHVGLSEVNVTEIEAARRIVPVATVQNQYNLAHRDSEDVLNYCTRNNIGFIPWFPLATGDLAKPVEFIAVGIDPEVPEILRFAQNDNLQMAWTQMTNGEDNATDRMTTRSRTRLVHLQQEIHGALSVQHPDWIEPDGVCPTCES